MNICPVCGFRMRYPPRDWHICPSCGTEFGYEDVGRTYEQIRSAWFDGGCRWWSPVEPSPPEWNPIEQLNNLAVYQNQVYGSTVLSYNNYNHTNSTLPSMARASQASPRPSRSSVRADG